MKRTSRWAWVWLLLGVLYFFVPLVATAQFSLLAKKGQLSLLAYQNVLTSPEFFQSFSFSFRTALITILASALLIVPTVYWVNLKPAAAAPGDRVSDAAADRCASGGAGVRADPHLQPHAAHR